MGKLKKDLSHSVTKINEYVKATTSDNKFWLEGTPTLVDYYKVNSLKSKYETTLEAVDELIGSDSPLKYDFVENIPIYGLDLMELSVEINELGQDNTYNGTFYIQPGIIIPEPNDFFYIQVKDFKYLFMVTNVRSEKTSYHSYYEVDFVLSHYTKEQIELQLNDSYVANTDNIGTQKKVVFETKEYLLTEKLEKLYMKLFDFYVNAFYNNELNLFICKYNNKNCVNDMLIHFIIKHNLFIKNKTFLKNIILQQIFVVDDEYQKFYKNSIYYACEINNTKFLTLENFDIEKYNNPKQPILNVSKDPLYGFVMYETNSEGTVNPYNNELIRRIKENDLYVASEGYGVVIYDKEDYFLENILINFINKNSNIDKIINDIDTYDFIENYSTYMLVPVLMYIIKRRLSDIVK